MRISSAFVGEGPSPTEGASLSEPWNVVVSSAFQQEESRLAKIVFLMIRHTEADVAKLESPRC